jgi:hypothetical protein
MKKSWLLCSACLLLATLAPQTRAQNAILFEGARLITGDGGAPIEDSAFLVENDRFTGVGK